jgi:hypothetical protein
MMDVGVSTSRKKRNTKVNIKSITTTDAIAAVTKTRTLPYLRKMIGGKRSTVIVGAAIIPRTNRTTIGVAVGKNPPLEKRSVERREKREHLLMQVLVLL